MEKEKKREKGRRTRKKIRRISRMGRPVRLVLDLKPTVCLSSFSLILISLDPPSVRSARFHPCVVVVSDQVTPPPFHPFPSFFPRALPASSSFPDLLFWDHAIRSRIFNSIHRLNFSMKRYMDKMKIWSKLKLKYFSKNIWFDLFFFLLMFETIRK